MRFIGWIERVRAIELAARIESRRPPGSTLELGELGTFRQGRRVRVVWAGLGLGAEAAAAVAEVVEAECAAAGLEPESRVFAPHLTLARARAREGAALPDLPPMPALGPWTADELILFQSHLRRAGATYEALTRIRLGASD